MSGGLTKKQRELLLYLRSYIAEHDGVAPSYDEMAAAMDLRSKTGIHRMIVELEERDFIRRIPNRARAIFLVEGGPSEFERGRAVGHAEGYRYAIRVFGYKTVGAAA